MNGSAVSGLMTIEGSAAEPRFPVTFLINDYITGYLGAIGAMAALVKRATEGGSWHVTVSLTRSAMWCGSLGFVDPAQAGCDDEHSLRQPDPYDAPSPLGDVHMLAPPVRFSRTPSAWPDPILVPRGSSRAEWNSSTQRSTGHDPREPTTDDVGPNTVTGLDLAPIITHGAAG